MFPSSLIKRASRSILINLIKLGLRMERNVMTSFWLGKVNFLKVYHVIKIGNVIVGVSGLSGRLINEIDFCVIYYFALQT